MLKLNLGLLVSICFLSCYSHEKGIERAVNSQKDSVDHTATPTFDSLNILQLTKKSWYNIITPDCITYITFQQDYNYEEYNCEWGLTFWGKYEISKDSIFLYEYGLASDLPGETRIVNSAIYTYIYQEDSLRFVSTKTIRNGKVIRTYFPDRPISYKSGDF